MEKGRTGLAGQDGQHRSVRARHGAKSARQIAPSRPRVLDAHRDSGMPSVVYLVGFAALICAVFLARAAYARAKARRMRQAAGIPAGRLISVDPILPRQALR